MAKKLPGFRGLSALALTTALLCSTSPAGAERYLFDMLFGDRAQQRTLAQPPRGRAEKVRRAVPRKNATSRKANPRGVENQRKAVKKTPSKKSIRKAPSKKVAVKSVPQIVGPSFHKFQPDPLVRVDFAALSPILPGAMDEGTRTPFQKALGGLSGFELLVEKNVAAALVEYYGRNPNFIWVDENGPTARANEVVRLLGRSDEFGLSQADYAVRVPIAGAVAANPDQRLKTLIRFEMTLSARALRYARDARLGRLDPNKLSGYHDFPAKPFDEKSVLGTLSSTATPAAYLLSFHPQNELYAALREELKKIHADEDDRIVVAPGTHVRPGTTSPEFPKILRIIDRRADAKFRAEHGGLLAAHMGSQTYAEELVPVIKAAQKRHSLMADGIVGSRTIRALTGEPAPDRIEKVLLAMERLRWHPSDLGDTRVMINVPSFTASYIENGAEKLSMRTVVGKPANQTYFFHDEIEYVEFNPYWGVPRSIVVNEMLPKLRRDPGYLSRAGYEVINVSGKRVPSSSVKWSAYGANLPYDVRQPPGPGNALGILKIMFPNDHDIYMHDTPQKAHFKQKDRARSHGCVRLADPRAMAAAVLGTSEEDVAKEVKTGRNMRRNLPVKIPVYVGYFTAWPEASGSVSYHPDIYERDAHLEKALAAVSDVRTSAAAQLLVAPESRRKEHEHGEDLQAAEQHAP